MFKNDVSSWCTVIFKLFYFWIKFLFITFLIKFKGVKNRNTFFTRSFSRMVTFVASSLLDFSEAKKVHEFLKTVIPITCHIIPREIHFSWRPKNPHDFLWYVNTKFLVVKEHDSFIPVNFWQSLSIGAIIDHLTPCIILNYIRTLELIIATFF